VNGDFGRWLDQLERRHLANLTPTEVARALRALSSGYVERRRTVVEAQRTLDGAGKRAAFALYYGPLHFLAVERIVSELGHRTRSVPGARPVVDLGCGTGAVGAALATALGASAVTGVDRHPWALDEARFTYATFHLRGSAIKRDAARWSVPRHPVVIGAGYVVNELAVPERETLLRTLAAAIERGSSLFLVEPLARAITPWWPQWVDRLAPLGARTHEWKLTLDPPRLVERLGTAAGLTSSAVNVKTIVAGF
jgi:hypothetical protein